MKRICFVTSILLLLFLAIPGCELKHKPGPEATCTEPQVCTGCGEVLVEALGHTPGAEATCTTDQVCTVCGEVLKKATGHTPGKEATCTEPQVCTVCGEVLVEALGHKPGPAATATKDQVCTVCGEVLVKATGGSGGSSGSTNYSIVKETQNSGHYHNNIQAAYAGNVLVCGDYGLEYFSLPTGGNAAYAQMINDFAAKYPNLNVTVELVPKSCAFNAPKGYTQMYENQQAYINSTYNMVNGAVKKADAIGLLAQHKGEYLYYRTDHHWTSLGAYYASVAYCNVNGITPRAISSYSTVINPGFIGTLQMYATGSLKNNLKANPDYTVGHLPATGYTMKYTTDGVTYTGTAINQSAKTYAGMFICGDQAFTHIQTENHNGRKLLVFKESYGNAFVPYMIDYYEEIIVVDIRYATDSVANIIAQYGITDALIINNVQASTSLSGQLKSKLGS